MQKKVCVILGAGALAVMRQVPREGPRARPARTENGFYVIYALLAESVAKIKYPTVQFPT